MAISAPTTILAAIGPSGAGPRSECEWACEWVTRNRVEGAAGRLLAVTGQEGAQPLDGVGQGGRPRPRHDAQVIRCRPIEPGALGDQDLLLQQQVEDQLLVVDDLVHL